MVDIVIREPGNPEGDPVFRYVAKIRPAGIGFAEVALPRWPDQPIGFVARDGDWHANLSLPPNGRDYLPVGTAPTRSEAVQMVVEAYHWRFAKTKVSWEWEREHQPVGADWQVVPGYHDKTVSHLEWTRRRSDLHRFLALNRWVFDKPSQIRKAQQ